MKLKQFITIGLAAAIFSSQPALAKMGDLGFFGGVSQGTRLPKTTEMILAATNSKAVKGVPLVYKEVIFLNGTPAVFEGTLTVGTAAKPTAASGTYTETYKVAPSPATAADVSIARDVTFKVNYRVEGNQTIKDYTSTKYAETITLGDQEFTVDAPNSHFEMSIIEDKTPGCVYYKGNISRKAVYAIGGEGGPKTTLDINGTFYGYNNTWSSTEAQRLDCTLTTDQWQMQYQVRPSVSVSKTLKYSENEPTAISFAGNYQEVMQNLSGLQYEIFVKPLMFYQVPAKGNVSISPYNTFEQLIAPDVSYLKGHAAEQEIKKLFALQILDGDPKFFQPAQAITRDQYVTALVKAIKLPLEPAAKNVKAKTAQKIVFPDVTVDRVTYPYIMAGYKNGLAIGRSDGKFYSDFPIDYQEAVTIMVRTLGLQALGLDPTPVTPFADDLQIASWAKKEVYAAQRLGLIRADDNGNFNPKRNISKAEASALLNNLVDYMRSGIATDYSENIVNYTR